MARAVVPASGAPAMSSHPRASRPVRAAQWANGAADFVYGSRAALPIYGPEDLGFVSCGEAGRFIAERNTAPGGSLPLNTNGGGLSYMHSGMYGMYALQESVRQMRGTAPPRFPMPRSRSATVSAACSPPAALSS